MLNTNSPLALHSSSQLINFLVASRFLLPSSTCSPETALIETSLSQICTSSLQVLVQIPLFSISLHSLVHSTSNTRLLYCTILSSRKETHRISEGQFGPQILHFR